MPSQKRPGASVRRMMAAASHGRNARSPAKNAKLPACVPGWNRLPAPALPVRHKGQVRLSLKAQGRARSAGNSGERRNRDTSGRDRFMNEAPTEPLAETGLPRRALAAARPFLVKADAFWTGVARAATIGIFLLLLTAALDLARTLFLPLVSALVFAFMFGPLQVAAERRRVQAWLFALACVVALIGLLNLIIILTAAPMIEWFGRGPDIVKSLGDKLQILAAPFSAVRDLQRALSPDSGKVGMSIEVTTFITPAFAFLTPALGELVVFFAALFFFLVARP